MRPLRYTQLKLSIQAVRGGGSGFGIITEFKIRTHAAPPTVLRITSRTPYTQSDLIVEQFLSWLNLTADPDLDPRLGTEYALEPSGSKITATWFGTKEEFERSGIMEQLPRDLTLVESQWGETARWVWENAKLYLADVPTEFFSRSLGFREDNVLSREAATELVDMFKMNKNRIDSNWFVIFDATGGEVAKPAMNSTAYAHRDKVRFYQSYGFNVMAPLGGLTRDYFNLTHQFILEHTGRPNTTYAGYADPYMEKPQEAYWGSNLARLQEIKLKWDPKDVFNNPQTVRPSPRKV
jgi:FAD/FMN-containing dehydrogenase